MSNHRARLITTLIFLSLVIDQVVSVSKPTGSNSGLYVDNGQDHTVIHKLTSKEEQLALQREILKLLGFPDKPKVTKGTVPSMSRSAPKFLLNIYKKSQPIPKAMITEDKSDFYLSQQELMTIDQCDVIVTFTAQQKHHGLGGKPDRVKRMWFDAKAIAPDDQMTSAELRLYRGPEATNQKNRGAFTITVYRVTKTSAEGDREMHLVDSVNTTAGQIGWLIFNITESLDYWIKNPKDNRGLYLSVSPLGRLDHEVKPENIGIVGFKGDLELQPFMVGFFKSSGLRQNLFTQPNLQELEIEFTRAKRSDADSFGDLLVDHYYDKAIQHDNNYCKLQTLYVSFKDLQWQEWIIAPEGYDANFCHGECNFPLTKNMNATNHAILQTLVNVVQPNKVPKPCCTPTQLSEISVLYFLDDNNVVLKKFKDMVARGCGCH